MPVTACRTAARLGNHGPTVSRDMEKGARGESIASRARPQEASPALSKRTSTDAVLRVPPRPREERRKAASMAGSM